MLYENPEEYADNLIRQHFIKHGYLPDEIEVDRALFIELYLNGYLQMLDTSANYMYREFHVKVLDPKES